jgi:CSLREA domain-containing protein
MGYIRNIMPKATIAAKLLFACFVISVLFMSFVSLTQVAENVFAATTITVNSIADDQDNDGECTLREAITAANSDTASGAAVGECAAGSGTDTIEFDISGVGPHAISPTSLLPPISQPVTIDGYSETGASENTNVSPATFNGTIMIEIDGTSAGAVHGLIISADNVVIRGLAVHDFASSGIYVSGVNGAVVSGNYLGTEADGTTAAGNSGSGVSIFDSESVTIGGNTEASRNVIAGNGDNGVYMQDATTTNISVLGNYIGLASDGTALGNTSHGIDIIGDVSATSVGSTSTGGRNVISNNGGDGVYIDDSNTVEVIGNYIGTDHTGEIDRGNTGDGVSILNGSTNNTVGGTTSAERNIISGNGDNGIEINGATSTSNAVSGNYIGTDDDGAQDLGNTFSGVRVRLSPANTIGGSVSGSGNTTSGNNESGIFITGETADGNIVSGNISGLTADGTVALGNTDDGVNIYEGADNTIIGGDTSAERNVTSGNGNDGINISDVTSTNTIITGNYVGTNAAGDADRGNSIFGINLTGTATVGGDSTGLGNVVSGNGSTGIQVDVTQNPVTTIQGNIVGLSADGTADLGNDSIGIAASNAQIGGTTSGARNVVSGNSSQGMYLTNNNVVEGNYIGLSSDGTTAIGNGGASAAGVQISGDDNVFGGSADGAGNVVSGNNTANGVALVGTTAFGGNSTINNTVQGNFIGTDPTGDVVSGFGNGTAVIFAFDAQDNLIGGTGDGETNVIAGNGAGIGGFSSNGQVPLNNTIVGNSIHSNDGSFSGLAIDWFSDSDNNFAPDADIGVTANDAGDVDTGTNDYLNFPVLDSSSASAGSLDVQFDLDVDGTAPNGYRIEFYANSTADTSGNGEGEIYLGSTDVAGDVTNEIASLSIPTSFTSGNYSITATTTEIDNSTDGFGATSELAENLDDQTITAAISSESVSPDASSEDSSGLANSGDSIWIAILGGLFMLIGVLKIATNQYTKKLQ